MSSVLAVALSAVFAWAAIVKLSDRQGTVDGFADLGLPRPVWLSVAVPASEIATALLLLLAPGWGGVLAFGFLAAFTGVLIVTIRSGRLVPCRCFGGSSDAPVSWKQVVRNGVLLVLATAVTPIDRLGWPSLSGFAAAATILLLGGLATVLTGRGSKVSL